MTGVRKEPGIRAYKKNGKTYWRIDVWLEFSDGKRVRKQVSDIPSLDLARKLRDKLKTDAFEGRYFVRPKANLLTVKAAWESFEPVSKREKKSWKTDLGRAQYLIKHLGDKTAADLNQKIVDAYRKTRLEEKTRRNTAPSLATLNRETGLLKRILNYAVQCGDLKSNPISHVKALKEDNVRMVMIEEADFSKLLEAADEALKPILLVAYDTGLRIGSILSLKWTAVSLTSPYAKIHLAPQDVKANTTPTVVLTDRVREALSRLPRPIDGGYVFVNPRTGKPWTTVRKMFARALKKAKLNQNIWIHDLRRSFITNARRRGVDESVVMSMSGHRTRSAFERYNIVAEHEQELAVQKIEAGRERDLQVAG